MNAQKKEWMIKAATWLVAEVVLNLVGLDNLADYSEFVFEQDLDTLSRYTPSITLVFEQPSTPALFI